MMGDEQMGVERRVQAKRASILRTRVQHESKGGKQARPALVVVVPVAWEMTTLLLFAQLTSRLAFQKSVEVDNRTTDRVGEEKKGMSSASEHV